MLKVAPVVRSARRIQGPQYLGFFITAACCVLPKDIDQSANTHRHIARRTEDRRGRNALQYLGPWGHLKPWTTV